MILQTLEDSFDSTLFVFESTSESRQLWGRDSRAKKAGVRLS